MTYLANDDYINYDNGSQHPFRGGGLYLGKVVALDSGLRPTVRIPSLGLTVQSCPVIGVTATQFIAVNNTVVCAFLENDNQEVVVLGRINISPDVFATKSELSALAARVTALENS